MNDRDMLFDIQTREKELANLYNSAILESTVAKNQNSFSKILDDQYSIIFAISSDMQGRSWESCQNAEQIKIDSVRQKYAQI